MLIKLGQIESLVFENHGSAQGGPKPCIKSPQNNAKKMCHVVGGTYVDLNNLGPMDTRGKRKTKSVIAKLCE